MSSPDAGTPRSRSALRLAMLTALFALAVHGGDLALKVGLHPSRSILAIFRIGGLNPTHPAFVLDQKYPMESKGYGSDGQQYLYIAHDPLVRRGDMVRHVDVPRYRYGRILLPLLAAGTCSTASTATVESGCIPRVIIAWNLLFVAGIGSLVAILVRERKGHPVWGFLLAATGGLMCATDIANVELAAQFFGLLGVLLVSRRRHGLAALAFALSALARETYALLPAGFALAALLERDETSWRRAITYGVSVVPIIGWMLYVRTRIPPEAVGGLANLSPPTWGVLVHFVEFARHPKVTGMTVLTTITAGTFLWMMFRHGRAVLFPPRDRSGVAVATLLFSLLALCSARAVWQSPGGFARALDFIYPGVVLCALSRGDRFTAWLAVPTLLHTLNIMADHFIDPHV